MTNLYEALGVGKDATPAAVKAAYRRAARKAHPDGGGSPERFRQIVLARDVLSDEQRKAQYDRTGKVDEREIDQTEAVALNLVMEAVNNVWTVAESRSMNIESIDAIGDAKIYLERKLHETEANKNKGQTQTEKLRKFAARFKSKKNKPNRISGLITARADEIARQIASLEPTITALKRALDIVSGHEYDHYSSSNSYAQPNPMLANFFTMR